MMNPQPFYGIQSTAGAIPVRNEKGKLTSILFKFYITSLILVFSLKKIVLSTNSTYTIFVKIFF